MTAIIDSARVRTIFNTLDRNNLQLVDELYDERVEFVDPFHTIRGREALRAYYAGMYANVQQIRFDFSGETATADELVLYWRMTYRHPRVGGGKEISVAGCTRLRFGANGKVTLHRDYFDAGEMLYEHLPLVGRVVRAIRERVG